MAFNRYTVSSPVRHTGEFFKLPFNELAMGLAARQERYDLVEKGVHELDLMDDILQGAGEHDKQVVQQLKSQMESEIDRLTGLYGGDLSLADDELIQSTRKWKNIMSPTGQGGAVMNRYAQVQETMTNLQDAYNKPIGEGGITDWQYQKAMWELSQEHKTGIGDDPANWKGHSSPRITPAINEDEFIRNYVDLAKAETTGIWGPGEMDENGFMVWNKGTLEEVSEIDLWNDAATALANKVEETGQYRDKFMMSHMQAGLYDPEQGTYNTQVYKDTWNKNLLELNDKLQNATTQAEKDYYTRQIEETADNLKTLTNAQDPSAALYNIWLSDEMKSIVQPYASTAGYRSYDEDIEIRNPLKPEDFGYTKPKDIGNYSLNRTGIQEDTTPNNMGDILQNYEETQQQLAQVEQDYQQAVVDGNVGLQQIYGQQIPDLRVAVENQKNEIATMQKEIVEQGYIPDMEVSNYFGTMSTLQGDAIKDKLATGEYANVKEILLEDVPNMVNNLMYAPVREDNETMTFMFGEVGQNPATTRLAEINQFYDLHGANRTDLKNLLTESLTEFITELPDDPKTVVGEFLVHVGQKTGLNNLAQVEPTMQGLFNDIKNIVMTTNRATKEYIDNNRIAKSTQSMIPYEGSTGFAELQGLSNSLTENWRTNKWNFKALGRPDVTLDEALADEEQFSRIFTFGGKPVKWMGTKPKYDKEKSYILPTTHPINGQPVFQLILNDSNNKKLGEVFITSNDPSHATQDMLTLAGELVQSDNPQHVEDGHTIYQNVQYLMPLQAENPYRQEETTIPGEEFQLEGTDKKMTLKQVQGYDNSIVGFNVMFKDAYDKTIPADLLTEADGVTPKLFGNLEDIAAYFYNLQFENLEEE